jgi:hypothetical protein
MLLHWMLFFGFREPGVFNMQKPFMPLDVRMISARMIAASRITV